MKLSRISRIVQILTTLQSGHNYSADELADVVDVSRRTIFRDLNELEAIGVPFSFDSHKGGYSIDPEYFLPSIDLNLQEALSLLLLVHKTRHHLPVPFKNSALLAGMKVENNLPANIRRYCNSTLQNISIKPDQQVPMDSLDKIFSQLQKATQQKRKVKLSYHSLYDKGDISLILHPYHLMYNNRAWYIMGHSTLHNSIRTFKLNRIRELDIMDKCFIQDKDFDIQEYLGRAWSMIPEGRIYNIKLRFSAMVARNVAEVQWHSTQKNTFCPDGSLEVEFRVDGLGEISWWILGYGDQAEVISPAALRKKIAATAAKVAQLNQE